MTPAAGRHVGLTILVLLAGACGGSAQCLRSSACGEAAVCRPDGTCGPLGIDAITHGARATWLWPSSISLRGAVDDGDEIALGPSTTMLLSFVGLPVADAPVSAELVLTPRASRADVPSDAHVTVDVVRPFSDARDPDTIAEGVATRDVPAGPARTVRIDVSEITRAAKANGLRALQLALHVTGGPLRIASVRARESRDRPRLEILVP